MNRNEKIWAALNREEPDGIPTHLITIKHKTWDAVLGSPLRTTFDVIDEFSNQYPDIWIERINGILINIEISIFSNSAKICAK